MNKIISVIILTAALSGCVNSKSAFKCVPKENVKMQKNAVLIDVRTMADFSKDHIKGARLIPHDEIKAKITTAVPNKKTPIYIYCRTGKRASMAIKDLKSLGYEETHNLCGIEAARKALNMK